MLPQSFDDVSLRLAGIADAASIAAIYNHSVETSTITFEERCVKIEEMATRIEEVRSKDLPWYVAVEAEQLMGYAYVTP